MLLFWRFNEHELAVLMAVMFLVYQNLSFCWSLNNEGLALLRFKERVESDPFGSLSNWKDDVGEENPCSWFGVECSDGNVVVLNLKDLGLKGTLAPDLGNLVHIKSIILRKNSFSGIIPEEIAKLNELEMLDLGYNNFSGPLPFDLGNNLSLAILLLDNNELLSSMSPEIYELKMLSEVQVDESELASTLCVSSCKAVQTGKAAQRKLLEAAVSKRLLANLYWTIFQRSSTRYSVLRKGNSRSRSRSPGPSPSPSISPSPSSSELSPTLIPHHSPPTPGLNSPPSLLTPAKSPTKSASPSPHRALILSAAVGGSLLLLILVIITLCSQRKRVAAVKPWATGLSGQLQKAFVTGVPKLGRSELDKACEDFSNVVGSLSVGTLYKGTLSSGVEIAVVSLEVASSKDWSKNLKTQFRKKIDTLSKVNHKNFVNLLGYCEEEEPFTRMIVFEYAPNGTLFEHVHIKEAEHLDWEMRTRIAMGIAYCLEYMHQLNPPIPHRNLTSSAVYLTEDYAAKVSDFAFSNEAATAEMEPNLQSNVYSFGVILFEMITGRLPYSVDDGSPEDWASDYLKERQNLTELVDPTLKSFQAEQLIRLGEVMKLCISPDPEQRPPMREVTTRLREIIAIEPDGAIPKLSPLWWAELEILSTEVD